MERVNFFGRNTDEKMPAGLWTSEIRDAHRWILISDMGDFLNFYKDLPVQRMALLHELRERIDRADLHSLDS